MYRRLNDDDFGNVTYACHCSDKQRTITKGKGMSGMPYNCFAHAVADLFYFYFYAICTGSDPSATLAPVAAAAAVASAAADKNIPRLKRPSSGYLGVLLKRKRAQTW